MEVQASLNAQELMFQFHVQLCPAQTCADAKTPSIASMERWIMQTAHVTIPMNFWTSNGLIVAMLLVLVR
jgi:hypothetical protein